MCACVCVQIFRPDRSSAAGWCPHTAWGFPRSEQAVCGLHEGLAHRQPPHRHGQLHRQQWHPARWGTADWTGSFWVELSRTWTIGQCFIFLDLRKLQLLEYTYSPLMPVFSWSLIDIYKEHLFNSNLMDWFHEWHSRADSLTVWLVAHITYLVLDVSSEPCLQRAEYSSRHEYFSSLHLWIFTEGPYKWSGM